ncbi:hypothetical protein HK098_003672 [Nowakowskiella sp. JEL0407]|nr:hypothetical protein HK098_003672 [Nowakowskiella sp. JEL0407]
MEMNYRGGDRVAIKYLANEIPGNSNVRIKRGRCSIPLSAVMIALTVGIFSLAIIPTCVIVFNAAQNAADELSTTIINSVIINLSAQVLDIMIGVKRANDHLLYTASIRDNMINLTNYVQHYEENLAAKVAFENSPYTERILCTQRFNLTGRAPVVQSPTGNKMINAFGYIKNEGSGGGYWNVWCDYTDLKNCYTGAYDFDTQAMVPNLSGPPTLLPPNLRPTLDEGYIYKKIEKCGTSGNWLAEAVFGNGFFSYANCGLVVKGAFGGQSPYTCGSAFNTSRTLPAAFKKVTPSTETRIFLADLKGAIISTNLDVPNIKNESFVTPSNFDDPIIKEIGKLISPKGDWSEVPQMSIDATTLKANTNTKVHKEYILQSNGARWMTVVSKVQFETPDVFYLVVAIPRKDFFGLVDSSIQQGITVSSIFAALGIVVGLGIIVGVLLPLRKLKKNIEKVTDFDFTLLSTGGLEENSVFSEVKAVQRTFNVMVKAFAGAIRRNRELATINSGGAGTPRSYNSYDKTVY